LRSWKPRPNGQNSNLNFELMGKKIEIRFESHIKLAYPSKPQLLVAMEKKL
jgi:hypothetical protein